MRSVSAGAQPGPLGCEGSGSRPHGKNCAWQIDRFADVRILRYPTPGWDCLTPRQRVLLYYLGQAALCGRDILFDQNYRHNLAIRRILEAVYLGYPGNRRSAQWQQLVVYLKRVWFSSGIHHHYSTDKLIPRFSPSYLAQVVESTPGHHFYADLPAKPALLRRYAPIMFDPAIDGKRVNQAPGVDMVAQSANNYYHGLTQPEVERFYGALMDPLCPTPVSHGLNSQLVKRDGRILERVWQLNGMYGPAIERIVYWLERAVRVADGAPQQRVIHKLVEYYRTGDLKRFDEYNVLWVNDLDAKVDFINGFIETYGDPLGLKASWESVVSFRDEEATRRARVVSANAQWFEDHSPIDPQFRKEQVRGVSAQGITVVTLGGDCYPASPLGINLPNAHWIRREHGSKSVSIGNIAYAHQKAAEGSGLIEEFAWDQPEAELHREWGFLAGNLHTDLHECLGHGSGRLAPGVTGDELRNYGAVIEEARADLFALYFIMDPRMVELGVLPTLDVARAQYNQYIRNALLTQLTRVELGRELEQVHMRNRQLVASWCYRRGQAQGVIERRVRGGKTYFVVTDHAQLRRLFGELLGEVQRIKSTGHLEGARELVEAHGVRIEGALHAEVLERFAALDLAPYTGFINPHIAPVLEGGQPIDARMEPAGDYAGQMIHYSRHYSYLPTIG